MFQGLAGSLSTFVRAPGQPLCVHGIRCYRENRDHWQQYDHPAHHPRLAAPNALAGEPSSSSEPPVDVIELSDGEDEPGASTALRSERERDVCTTLRGVEVPPGWSVVGGSLLVWSHLSPAPSTRIAAFDFDDTLAKTALGGFDPNAWSNLFPHVPAVLPVRRQASLAAAPHSRSRRPRSRSLASMPPLWSAAPMARGSPAGEVSPASASAPCGEAALGTPAGGAAAAARRRPQDRGDHQRVDRPLQEERGDREGHPQEDRPTDGLRQGAQLPARALLACALHAL